ncbi:MAG TPA: hypothetical protein VIH71_14255 [Solirubrobacteraceae bacterium]
MSRTGLAAMICEIAAGIAAQTSGVGGIYATAAAGSLTALTGGYLYRNSRSDLVEQLRRFIVERQRDYLPGIEPARLKATDADTTECFERRFGSRTRRQLRRLHARGEIGINELQELERVGSLTDVKRLTDRLAELAGRTYH